MPSGLKITFGILILAIVAVRGMKGNYRGVRRNLDFVFLGFAGVYLIAAGILDLLHKT
jgi:hypothetical protein